MSERSEIFQVRIALDGSAFEHDREGEIARLLREIASHVEDMGSRSGRVRDHNGNFIGAFETVAVTGGPASARKRALK